MNWLQDIISKFSVQGLAVVGLAYFRDIGKGGVRTVTITNRDGEITPVALNEDYNGYIRAINNANYRLREAIDCTANLYDVEQDVAIVMWVDRKVNPNGVMQAIQQAVAGNDILNTTFDKQVILNEEGLPENDYLMLKVVVRMVSEYAGSSCPADVCAVYYDPCFEVPSRPEPQPPVDPCGCECTVNTANLQSFCLTFTKEEYLTTDPNSEFGYFAFFINDTLYDVLYQDTYFNKPNPITKAELISYISGLVINDPESKYVVNISEDSICLTLKAGYQGNIIFSFGDTRATSKGDFCEGILITSTGTIVNNECAQDTPSESDYRFGVVELTSTGTEETKTICEWITDHEERITALEEGGGGGITCETLQECEVIGNLEERITDIEEDFSNLATVATTGSYDDLSDKPTIPTLTSQLTNDSGYQTASQVATAIANKFQFLADLTNTSVNTNSTNVVLGSVLIPANTITGDAILEVETAISRATAGANPLHRLFINTINSYTGATQIAGISTSTTALWSKGERTFKAQTGILIGYNATNYQGIDDIPNANAPTQTVVDWTVDQYFLTVANNATGEITTHEITTVKVIKP
jgi:hypothetical protein